MNTTSGSERMWPDLPQVAVVVKNGSAFVVECPFCGDVHSHGHDDGDPTEPGSTLGMRLSHCLIMGKSDTYELVIAPAGTVIPKKLRVRYDRDGRLHLVPRKPKKEDIAA